MRRAILAALVAALLIAPVVQAAPSSEPFVSDIVLLQTDLHYGDSYSFFVRFPQEAARNARRPQFEEAPIIQTNCYPYATGTLDYLAQTWTQDRWKVTGGWEGVTWPRPLDQYRPFGGRYWLGGGAHCVAYLASFAMKNDQLVTTIWDTTSFEVSP